MSLVDTIKKLLASDLTSYKIAKDCGMSPQYIDNYRTGRSKIENMALGKAEKLINYWEEITMKFYVNGLTKVLEFDGADFGLEHDDNGIYCKGKDMYEWLQELDQSINKLYENGVNVEVLQVNEYDDYIKMAEEL